MHETRLKNSNVFNNNKTSTFTSSILNNIVAVGSNCSAQQNDTGDENEPHHTTSASLNNSKSFSTVKSNNLRINPLHNANFVAQCRPIRPSIVAPVVISPTSRSLTEFLQTISQQQQQNPQLEELEEVAAVNSSTPRPLSSNNKNNNTMGSLTALLPLSSSTQRTARRFWRIYLHRFARLDVCIVLLLILFANVAIFSLIFVNGRNNSRNSLGSGSVLVPIMPTALERPPMEAAASSESDINNSANDGDNEDDESVLPMPKTFDDFETLLTSLELDHDVPVNKIVELLKTTVKGGEAEKNMLEGFMSGVKCMRSLSTGAKCEKPDFFQQIHDAVKSGSPKSSDGKDEESSVFSKASRDLLHSMNINGNGIKTPVEPASTDKQKFEQFKSVWLTDMGPILIKQFSGIKMTQSKVRALLAGLDAQMLRQYVVPFLPTDRETLSRMVTTLYSLAGISASIPMPNEIHADIVEFVQHIIIRMKEGYISLFGTLVQEKLEEWMIRGQCGKISQILRYFSQALPAGYGNKMWQSAKHIGLQPLLESFTNQTADGDGTRAAHDQLLERLKNNMTDYDATLVETQWISSGGWDACLLKPLATAGMHLFGTAADGINKFSTNVTPEQVSHYIATDFSAFDPVKYPRAALNTTYLIENKQFCKKPPSVDVIIMVLTHVANREWRDAVRKTFGKPFVDETLSLSYRVIFVVGTSNEQQPAIDLQDEQNKFDDVLQIDVADGDNDKQLVTKVLAALQWFNLNCPRQQFVVKVDENVFINPANLMAVLEKQSSNDGRKPAAQLIGQVHTHAIPMRLPFLSTFVPDDMYKIQQFPAYLDGGAYVLHSTVVPELLSSASKVPLLPSGVEPEFITGILPVKAAAAYRGMQSALTHSAGFATPNMLHYRPDWCRLRSNLVVLRNVLPEKAITIWRQRKEIADGTTKC